MYKEIDFYFDFGSPTSYLAFTQLPLIAKKNNAKLIFHPILLGGIFKETGNEPPGRIPAKGLYMSKDLQRFAKKYEVEFNHNPYFPINTLSLMRGAISYQIHGDFDKYINVIFHSMWVDQKNTGDPEVLKKILDTNDLDYNDFISRISNLEIKNKLISNTSAAVARGVFGAPTMFVGEEMFFGQDRFDFIEDCISH